jgi:Domain of unknown function (DUF4384)
MFGIRCLTGWTALGIVAIAGAQPEKTEQTRQMYYLAPPEKDAVPSPKDPAGTLHLGIRYNVLLIGTDRQAHQVPSDHVFKDGDCFAIDLQANRFAYLYMLARQSSGTWTPLTDMPGQQDVLPTGKKVRIPVGACFQIHNPPGTETMFVVLSRDKRDFYELYTGVKASEGGSRVPSQSSAGKTQMASTEKVNAAVEHLEEKFGGSRDISIAKIDEPTHSDEPTGAVYVVNTSKNLSTTLVTRIQVHHN